jgi:hypothetical protein
MPVGYLLVMTGQLPKDLMLDEYPDPVPLHPDDVVSRAESAEEGSAPALPRPGDCDR